MCICREDDADIVEDGVDTLNTAELHSICYVRQLTISHSSIMTSSSDSTQSADRKASADTSHEHAEGKGQDKIAVQSLQAWLQLSQKLQVPDSLLMHAPALIYSSSSEARESDSTTATAGSDSSSSSSSQSKTKKD